MNTSANEQLSLFKITNTSGNVHLSYFLLMNSSDNEYSASENFS